jgi:hypothetical protein
MRFGVKPRDVPPLEAARRLGVDLKKFNRILPNLQTRGFPEADPDTGNFDLDAIDAWRRARHPHLFLTEAPRARDAKTIVSSRLRRMNLG